MTVVLNINIVGERLTITHQGKVIAKTIYTPERLHQLIKLLTESYVQYQIIEGE